MPPYQSIFSMGRDYGAYGTPQQWQDIERTAQDPRFGAEARTMLANRDRSSVDSMTGGYGIRSSYPYQSNTFDSRYSMPYLPPTSPQALGGLIGGMPGNTSSDYFASLASSPKATQRSDYVQGPVVGMMVKRETPEDVYYRVNYGKSKAEFDRNVAMGNEQAARQRENYSRFQDRRAQTRNYVRNPSPRGLNQSQMSPSQRPTVASSGQASPFSGQNLGQFLGSFGPGQFSGQALGQFLGGGAPNTQPATGGGLIGPSSSSTRMSRRFASPERMTSPSRVYGSQRSFFA